MKNAIDVEASNSAVDQPPAIPCLLVLEAGRLAFLERRDGIQGALDFARRTLGAYRSELGRNRAGRRTGYGSVYRRSILQSCLDFRRYIRARDGSGGEP